MDAQQELGQLLENPERYALLICALDDYVGVLEGHIETATGEADAAYFRRAVSHIQGLRDVFCRWP